MLIYNPLNESYLVTRSPSLNRNNVALTNKRAVEITEDSVLLEDGTSVPADIIVHANGFKTETFSLQMDIRGQDMSLAEYWKTTKTPQAYRGSMVSGFPNLFVIWGPNTATGHFSAIWTIESTVSWPSDFSLYLSVEEF